MGRKRRTVLWLYREDYDYLATIAKADGDSKSNSMRRLTKALRQGHVASFLNLAVEQPSPITNVTKMRRVS